MCCESCIRYEKCLEDDQLKDDCCPRCPEFDECSGTDKGQRDNADYANGREKEEDYY